MLIKILLRAQWRLPLSLNNSFLLGCLLCLSAGSAACQANRELTRSSAQQQLIVESNEFKQPSTVPLVSQAENPTTPFWFDKVSDSETAEQSQARSIPALLAGDPQLAAFDHLGLITIESAFVKEEKANGFHYRPWLYFTIKIRASEKGRALWKKLGMPPSDEAIPLGKKQFGAVTGITKLAENQAKADFTWKWISTAAGKSLDESTDEFKALPRQLQNELLGQTENNYHPQTMDLSSERRISGLFQRFDDGWRFVRLEL